MAAADQRLDRNVTTVANRAAGRVIASRFEMTHVLSRRLNGRRISNSQLMARY